MVEVHSKTAIACQQPEQVTNYRVTHYKHFIVCKYWYLRQFLYPAAKKQLTFGEAFSMESTRACRKKKERNTSCSWSVQYNIIHANAAMLENNQEILMQRNKTELFTCSCIMDLSIRLVESFSNLLLINNAVICIHQALGLLVITCIAIVLIISPKRLGISDGKKFHIT